MPTYEYKCEECGIVFERFQHFSEQPLKSCPECEGTIHRVIHPVGVIFKGKGFYVTDHAGGKLGVARTPSGKEDAGKTTSDSSESPATTTAGTSKKDD